METTTKKWKTEKLKKAQICLEVTVNSPGNQVVSPEEEEKATVGRICRKGRF